MDNIEIVRLEDQDGQTMRMVAVGDVMVPPFPGIQDHFEELKGFKFRDDDIILTTYPRSGTHLMWEILRMLKQGSAEYYPGDKMDNFLEIFFLNKTADNPDRIINTHYPPELLPLDYRNRKCKFIHVYRNPKDVMVSLYNHCLNAEMLFGYDGKFPAFFELAVKGQVESGNWFDYELKYEEFFRSNPYLPVIVLSFEDLKQDPVGCVRKTSDFLGLLRDEKLFSAIADAVSFNKMKAAKLQVKSEVLKQLKPSKEMLARMYRKGEIGDWKNWLTVAQNERFDVEFAARMKGSGLMDKIKWEV